MYTRSRKFLGTLPIPIPHTKTLTMRQLLDGLPATLKTPNSLELLNTYFLIPQSSARGFVFVLLGRLTGDTDIAYPLGDLAETEYLLTQYAQLSTSEMRDKVSTLVRQLCTANGGNIGELAETIQGLR
jgi:hypothetical protein